MLFHAFPDFQYLLLSSPCNTLTPALTPSTMKRSLPAPSSTQSSIPTIPAQPKITTLTSSPFPTIRPAASTIRLLTSSVGTSWSSVAFNPVVSTPANRLLLSLTPKICFTAEVSRASHCLPVETIPNEARDSRPASPDAKVPKAG